MTTVTSWSAPHSLNDTKVVSRCSQSPPLVTPLVCSDFTTTRYASGFSGFRSSLLNRTFWWPFQVHGGSQSNTLYNMRCQRSGRNPLFPLNRATPQTRDPLPTLPPPPTPVFFY